MPIRPSAPPVAGNARRLHASRRNSPESSDCPARRPFARPIFFGGPTTIVILSFGLAPFFRIRQQRVENTPMRPTPEASDRPDRDGSVKGASELPSRVEQSRAAAVPSTDLVRHRPHNRHSFL